MRKLLTLMMTTLMLVAFGIATAEAVSTDTISVTVTITASALDVSVTPDTWAIGNIAESALPNTTTEIGGPDYFTATSGRTNATEDLTLTAASSDDWTFADAPDADTFGMNFSTDAGLIWTPITVATGGLLADNLAASGTETFDLQLEAPTSTTIGGTPQTIVVTVTAS